MLSDMEINALCREIAAATLEEMTENEYDERSEEHTSELQSH